MPVQSYPQSNGHHPSAPVAQTAGKRRAPPSDGGVTSPLRGGAPHHRAPGGGGGYQAATAAPRTHPATHTAPSGRGGGGKTSAAAPPFDPQPTKLGDFARLRNDLPPRRTASGAADINAYVFPPPSSSERRTLTSPQSSPQPRRQPDYVSCVTWGSSSSSSPGSSPRITMCPKQQQQQQQQRSPQVHRPIPRKQLFPAQPAPTVQTSTSNNNNNNNNRNMNHHHHHHLDKTSLQASLIDQTTPTRSPTSPGPEEKEAWGARPVQQQPAPVRPQNNRANTNINNNNNNVALANNTRNRNVTTTTTTTDKAVTHDEEVNIVNSSPLRRRALNPTHASNTNLREPAQLDRSMLRAVAAAATPCAGLSEPVHPGQTPRPEKNKPATPHMPSTPVATPARAVPPPAAAAPCAGLTEPQRQSCPRSAERSVSAAATPKSFRASPAAAPVKAAPRAEHMDPLEETRRPTGGSMPQTPLIKNNMTDEERAMDALQSYLEGEAARVRMELQIRRHRLLYSQQ